MKKAVFLVIILSLGGCRSANKLLQKAIEKGAGVKVDTIREKIPVIVPEIRVDTTFVPQPGDTVRITKDRLKLKYVRLPGDTVFLDAECSADTIVKEVPVTVTRTIEAESGLPWWTWAVIGFLAIVVLGLLFRR